MKHLKMLALAAVAAGALMALLGASTASATVLCSTTVEPCPEGQKWPANTVLDFSIPSGSFLSWRSTSNEELARCSTSTIEAHITTAGSSTETVTAKFSEPLSTTGLTWGECGKKTISAGGLEIHKIAGTSNGTVTADSNIEWTTNDPLLGSCVEGFKAGTSLGDITEGSPARFDVNAVVEKFSGLNCLSSYKLTGTYVLTSPSNTTLSVGTS